MKIKNVADLLIHTLAEVGVKRIYGVVGDSLNGVTEALREHGGIEWVGTRHEEVAAFAASGESQVTNELAVCAGSCGPGNLHLINGLFDAHRSRTPVLAIAAHIPSAEIGSGYFQETHPEQLFKECSHYCEVVSHPNQLPYVFENAIRAAIGQRGVAVIVLPGDIALQPAPVKQVSPRSSLVPVAPTIVPDVSQISVLANLLNQSKRITVFAGRGCAGAHSELMELAQILQSPITHALGGKEHVEYNNPYDVGMTGFIGFASGYKAMHSCDTLLMLGTDFPYKQFLPSHVQVIQVDIRPENLGRRVKLDLGVVGDIKATLQALIPHLTPKNETDFLKHALNDYKKSRSGLDCLAQPGQHAVIHPQYLTRLLSEKANENAVFTADVGTPTVWAARYLEMNGKRRLIGSFTHGSMANAMPQAIGIQMAQPQRQVISLSGDGGFSMLMGDLLSLKQHHVPVKVVIVNNGVLGFVALEMKVAGFINTGVNLDNPNFAQVAQAVGVYGERIEDPAQLPEAIERFLAHDGPAVLDVVTASQELIVPPTIHLDQIKGFSMWGLRAVMDDQLQQVVDLARVNVLER